MFPCLGIPINFYRCRSLDMKFVIYNVYNEMSKYNQSSSKNILYFIKRKLKSPNFRRLFYTKNLEYFGHVLIKYKNL